MITLILTAARSSACRCFPSPKRQSIRTTSWLRVWTGSSQRLERNAKRNLHVVKRRRRNKVSRMWIRRRSRKAGGGARRLAHAPRPGADGIRCCQPAKFRLEMKSFGRLVRAFDLQSVDRNGTIEISGQMGDQFRTLPAYTKRRGDTIRFAG